MVLALIQLKDNRIPVLGVPESQVATHMTNYGGRFALEKAKKHTHTHTHTKQTAVEKKVKAIVAQGPEKKRKKKEKCQELGLYC